MNCDGAFCSGDDSLLRCLCFYRAGENCQLPVIVAANHCGLLIDAGLPYVCQAGNFCRRPAKYHRGQRYYIDSDVEQRAASQLRIEQAMLGGPITGEAEISLEDSYLADSFVAEPVADLGDYRQEACPHCLHKEELFVSGGVNHLLCAAGIYFEGLFAKDSFSGI